MCGLDTPIRRENILTARMAAASAGGSIQRTRGLTVRASATISFGDTLTTGPLKDTTCSPHTTCHDESRLLDTSHTPDAPYQGLNYYLLDADDTKIHARDTARTQNKITTTPYNTNQ